VRTTSRKTDKDTEMAHAQNKRASRAMGKNRAKVNPVDRKHKLVTSGKLPKPSGSRRSDVIRAVSDSLREEVELGLMDLDEWELVDVC